MEIELCAMWSTVLGIDELGIDDNFFELGGDSLRATRVIASLTEVFGADLPIKTFFEVPTIAQLAEQLLLARVPHLL